MRWQVYERLWCVHEVDEAIEAKVPIHGLFDAAAWSVAASSAPPAFDLATYRAMVAAALGATAAARGLGPLKRWLDAAHGAARDARYLVGLRLQNHVAK